MNDQELLPDKKMGRLYYHVQFFTGTAEDGVWLYAQGLGRTRDIGPAELDRWIDLLEKQGLPYRVYRFKETTERCFVGGFESEGKV